MPVDSQPLDFVTRELDLRTGMAFVESERQLQQLLTIARAVEFRRGEKLFERGTPVANVFLIAQGDVDLVSDDAPTWRIVGSGGIGFLDFTMGRPYTRTAIARTDVRALAIDAADYREYMHDNVDVAHRALATLGDGLIEDMIGAGDGSLLSRAESPHALPEAAEPTLVDRVLLLSRTPAFARATVQALANLARGAELVRVPAGQLLTQAGVRCEVISVLVRGQVEVSAPGTRFVAVRGPVDLVSHAAELSRAPRALSARAVRDSVVLQIHREELIDRMDEHFELFQSLVAYVAMMRESLNNAKAARGGEI